MSRIVVTAPDGKKYEIRETLSVEKIMEIFDVTRVTVYNWLGKRDKNNMYSKGKFPHAFKMGKIYIPIIDVTDVVQNKQTL